MELPVNFIERIVRTPTANSYRFTRPPDFSFRAGQYMLVRPGRKGEPVHPLSFSDGPQQDFLEFTKRMTGSVYCRYLENLRPGDSIMVNGPMGCFSSKDITDNIVCIAGGIGITPIRSILADLAYRHDRRAITLIYGNQKKDDIAFARELAELNLPDFRLIHVLEQSDSQVAAHPGLINADIIRSEVDALDSATFLVSGPPFMVKIMEEQLGLLGVGSKQIRTDRFFGYA